MITTRIAMWISGTLVILLIAAAVLMYLQYQSNVRLTTQVADQAATIRMNDALIADLQQQAQQAAARMVVIMGDYSRSDSLAVTRKRTPDLKFDDLTKILEEVTR